MDGRDMHGGRWDCCTNKGENAADAQGRRDDSWKINRRQMVGLLHKQAAAAPIMRVDIKSIMMECSCTTKGEKAAAAHKRRG